MGAVETWLFGLTNHTHLQPSTLTSQHSLNTQHSTHNTQPTTLHQGAVETWLFGLTNHTHDALKAKMNESVSAFDEKPRHDFIFDWCAELVSVVCRIVYTEDVNWSPRHPRPTRTRAPILNAQPSLDQTSTNLQPCALNPPGP